MDFIDEYTHSSPKLIYFPQNIPTREVEETIEQSRVSCNCKELCTEALNCTCMQHSGTIYSFTAVNDLGNYVLTNKNVNMPTYECNDQCNCKNMCGNRLVQHGPRKGLTVKMSDDSGKGEGIFTDNPIKSGNFVCEYAGEIITDREASTRYKKNSDVNCMNYIFCIDEHFGENNIRTFIDPTYYGNIGRYVNHSCEPNCIMVIIRINSNIPVLSLFACEDIEIGQELSYDYGTSFSKEYEVGESHRTKCLCGSKVCRGYLPFDSRFM